MERSDQHAIVVVVTNPDTIRGLAVEAVRRGSTFAAAARLVGVSPPIVSSWCRDANVARRADLPHPCADPAAVRKLAVEAVQRQLAEQQSILQDLEAS